MAVNSKVVSISTMKSTLRKRAPILPSGFKTTNNVVKAGGSIIERLGNGLFGRRNPA